MSEGAIQGLSEAKRKLLARMLSGQAPARDDAADAIEPRPEGAPAPISVDQRNVWLHASTAGDVPIYNEPVTVHRHGPLDRAVLVRTVGEIMRRHELWRTAFVPEGEQVMQVVHRDVAPPVAFAEAASVAEAERLAAADVRRPIDLLRAPLFRLLVVRLGEAEHRLYFTLHHMVFDGVSVHRVLPAELAAIHDAFAAGRAHALPPPPVQFGDYALWRARRRDGPEARRQRDYWRDELAGDPVPARPPTDRPRPPVPGHEGGAHGFALPGSLIERVRGLARARGATVYMVALAVFKTLLFRYSGQNDFVVGGIVDMRRRPELRDLLGYFLNAVALRTAPDAALPFDAYLAQVKGKLLAALDAAEVPFDEVVRAARVRREAGAHPLFEVLFSVQPPPEAPPPTGWDVTQMDVPTGVAKFDLYLELEERIDGLVGRFIYRTDLFDAATIARMAGHYVTLLESACADPARPLGRLDMITPPERALLLRTWNDSAWPVPAATLPELIAAQVARVPERIAVEGEGRRLSYAALDRRSARLAAMLRAAGAGRGALVAVCAARTPDLLVALLGVMRAGAAYVPLDPALPRARFATLMDDARPAIVLTQVELLGVLPPHGAPLVLLDDLDVTGDAVPAGAPAWVPVAPEGGDLAYVLYTSGSTGAPKGVEIEHRSLANLVAGMARTLGQTERDVLLAVTTISFDIAALEMFMPLILGGRIVIAGRDDVVDPRRLIELVAASGATTLQATPAGFRGLLAAGWSGEAELTVLAGGEAFPRSLARALAERARAVWNGYGPTETTIYSSAHRIEDEDGPVPIGWPTANTHLHVLDPRGELVPVGVPGELHIGGMGLARGYRGRAELTAERFVTRAGVLGERLYATGDLVVRRADGQLVWLARIDTQVKVRGYRVELGEITETLARHPAVAAAAVVDHRDAAGETGLLACIVPRAAPGPSAAELRGFLRQVLPDYVVPGRYVQVAALPLTPNGKVDRFAILALAEQAPAAPVAAPAPASPLVQALAPVWQEVLGVRTADPADNFFEVGGHSLLAARLLVAIEARLGRRLSMTAIFRAQTLGGIAALLDAPHVAPTPAPSGGQAEARALLSGFESLGEDCEFGLLQRRFGAEPLGLFRFASVRLGALIAALEAELAGIDDPATLSIAYDPAQGASLVRQERLDFGYLLFERADGDTGPLRLREARRLAFLRRKFLEDVTLGGRPWVVKSRQGITEAQVHRLVALLRARGPATVLWVDLADAAHAPGEVARVGDGLIRGWIDRFAPVDAMHDSSDVWLDLCRGAAASLRTMAAAA